MRKFITPILFLAIMLTALGSSGAISLSFTKQDVSCNGGNNGSINLTPSGGVPVYLYSWSNGAIAQNISGLLPGIYSVTVTDALLQTATISVNIAQPAAITTTTNITNVNCGGGNNGAIDLTVNGGTPGYTYLWSSSQPTQDISTLTAATYYVTITDSKGCIKVDSANVIQPPGLVLSKTTTNVTCGSGANGAINLSVSFGTPSYTYLWSNGATTEDLTGIAAGNYSVTVTDAGSCSASTTATVGQTGGGMSINHTAAQPSCFGGSNGNITVTSVIGSVGPYYYTWSNGAAAAANTNIAAGTYTVTVTSNTGCTASKTVSIAQPTATGVTLNVIPVTCFGGNNGAINSVPTGGTAPYSYSWVTGAFTQNVTGLASGTYSLTVTDSKGCTATNTAYVPQPLALNANSTPSPLACSGGPTGSVTTLVAGGVGPYTYLWNIGGSSPNLINANSGTYTVTVTDGNGCTATASATIPPYTPMTTSATQVNNVCNGGTSGSINLSVNNGKSPFTYNWTNGATVQNPTGLAAGIYSVTVTDANGCTATRSVTITQPSFAVSFNTSSSNPVCNGAATGTINISPLNGTAPYTFNWNDGSALQNRTGLAAGSFSVTVTDNVGCSASGTIAITQPSAIVINSTATHATCFGSTNGAINTGVTGGTAPLSFLWNSGQTTQNITGIAAGNYVLTVTDNLSCTVAANVAVNQQPAISITLNATAPTCAAGTNGSINTTVSGGTSPYTFNWGGGVTTQNRTGLAAGSYAVIVTDNIGCTATQTANITSPSAINTTSVVTNVACNGGNTGAITLNVVGGTSPYTFNWGGGITTQNRSSIPAGSYTVTVTDNLGCTATHTSTVSQTTTLSVSSSVTDVSCNGGSNGAITISVSGGTTPYTFNWGGGVTTQNRTALTAGSYTITVTDNAGCTMANTTSVSQPAIVSVSGVVTNVACAGGNSGAINIAVSGGTPNYSYNWGGGVTTQNRSAIPAGTYNVTITDALSCTATASFNVTQSPTLSVVLTPTNITCNAANNGAIATTTTGGTTPYTYNWGGGIATQNRTGLSAGSYTLTVTDNAGCSGSASTIITEPTAVAINTIKTDVSCNGDNNGTITLTVSGGTGAHSFNWGGGVITQNRTNLTAATYVVTVTDANNCTASSSTTITQPALLTVSASKTDVACFGQSNGTVSLTVNGGTTPYSFAWSNGPTTQNLNAVAIGSYIATVTDAKNCSATTTATVNQPNALSVSTVVTDATCFGAQNGSINLTVSGGTGAYIFAWSNTSASEDISFVQAGNYSVNVTDANGCVITTSATINQPDLLIVNHTVTNIGCAGATTGSISSVVTGGTSPFSYSWSNAATTATISNLNTGSYTVTVTDANACTAVKTSSITQALPLSYSFTKGDINCFGGFNGYINTTPSGGTAPFTYYWMDGVQTQNRANLTASTYSVTVTDANNCTASVTATLTQPTQMVLNSTKTNVACNGAFTGSIMTNTTGGTGSYTYLWNNNAITQHLTSIQAGTYTLTVTDANGCTVSKAETITQPQPLTVSMTMSNVTCYGGNNGSITINPSGGNGGYVFNWSNGATTATNSNLIAGNYTMNMADSLGCSTSMVLNISQPTFIVLSPVATAVSCQGGSNGGVTLNISGGASNYTYLWSNGATSKNLTAIPAGNYTVTATDGSNCTITAAVAVSEPALLTASATPTNILCSGTNSGAVSLQVNGGTAPYTFVWSNNATTQNISNVSAASYSVVITDAANCQANASATVTQTTAIQVSLVKTDVTCFGMTNGSITTSVTGGNGGFTYVWNNNATTQNLSNIGAGSYTLNVTDAAGCTASASISIGQAVQLNVATNITHVTCNGLSNGSVAVSVNGGLAPYSYNWTNGATTANNNNLSANSYSVTVTDANTCSAVSTVSVTQPAVLTATETHQPYACSSKPGSITLTVSGGTAPYSYNWSNATTTQNQSNLNAGSYTVTVTDSKGCVTNQQATITALPPLSASISKTDVLCHGAQTGAATVSVSGGTAPYSILWNNSATTATISSITAGNYAVAVTDANNCSLNQNTTITEPSAISIIANPVHISCFGQADGSVAVTVTGGVSPYSFNWSNSAATQDISNLAAGNFTLSVTDANACQKVSAPVAVTEPALLTVVNTVTAVGCASNNDGAVALSVAGGTAPYSFTWTNGAATQNINQLTTGNYAATVTDARGCVANTAATVGLTPPLVVTYTKGNTSCPSVQNAWVDLNVSGGTPPYAYIWNNNNTAQDAVQLPQGNYAVTVTDSRQCNFMEQFSITYDYILTMEVTEPTTVNLGQGATLTATTNVDHGNMFTWAPAAGLSCTSCASTEASPVFNTNYSVQVIDTNGCTASGSTSVSVNSITDLFIPNAFSPNNDNNNDVFKIYGDVNTIQYLDFKVFNRWGEMVFSSNHHYFEWDGTYKGELVDRGNYIYTMKVVFVNGYSRDDYKGSITIIR